MVIINEHGQPIGPDLHDWAPPPPPTSEAIPGDHATLVPADSQAHARALFAAFESARPSLWTYMSFGPFDDPSGLKKTLEEMVSSSDWVPFTVFVGDEPLGFSSYLRIVPRDGVIEIGSITFSPRLQRTTAGTEAIYLLIRNVFDLGYRRCEWKCDHLNAPSRQAAIRFGFTFEGIFRNATHYKGRSRDTAWYSIIDSEWPTIDRAFRRWLAPGNFDARGRQRQRLTDIREGN